MLSEQDIKDALSWADKFTLQMREENQNSSQVLCASIAFQLAALAAISSLQRKQDTVSFKDVKELHEMLTMEISKYALTHGIGIIT